MKPRRRMNTRKLYAALALAAILLAGCATSSGPVLTSPGVYHCIARFSSITVAASRPAIPSASTGQPASTYRRSDQRAGQNSMTPRYQHTVCRRRSHGPAISQSMKPRCFMNLTPPAYPAAAPPSSKPRFPRAAALAVAAELCAALKPLCPPDRLKVCGSLRRRKAEVGDVEIVYVGRVELRPDPEDLLGRTVPANLAEAWLAEALRAGVLAQRLNKNGSPAWGAQNKLAVHAASGIPVDFFQGTESGWWSLVVCRTGSAAHNTRLCLAAIERGWQWDPYHGFKDRATGRLLHTPRSERAVFELVGLPYLEPWERS